MLICMTTRYGADIRHYNNPYENSYPRWLEKNNPTFNHQVRLKLILYFRLCLRNRARVPATGRHGLRAYYDAWKRDRESNKDLVAGPDCFLGPTFKELPVPPNSPMSPRRGVSWSDADQVIAI